MKTIILTLITITSFAQLREPVKETIFYERVSANILNIPVTGRIEIFTDTLHAFDITWTIKRRRVFKTDGGDKLLEAIMDISHKGQNATLMVINKRALFMVPGLQDIEMIQLPHDGWRY